MIENPQIVVLSVVLLATIGFAYLSTSGNSVKVPKVGYSWYTSSSSKELLDNVRETLLEGCKLFPDGFFNIKLYPYGTLTVVTNKKLVNELRNTPDEILDFTRGAARIVLPKYTMSAKLTEKRFHVPTIRTTLTRNLGYLFEDMVDEMRASFDDNLGLTGNEWKTVLAYPTIMRVVTRTSNRVVVGLPFCRDKEYCDINVMFTIDCMKTAKKINWYPEFLHPIVGPLYSKATDYRRRTFSIIGSEINRRIEMLDKYGTDWADKPNDYLSWVMEEDSGPLARDPEYLTLRILQFNFASIHTSSITFSHALYYLAIHPEYADILRDEAFEVIKREGGWTKAAMREMKRGDSFLKESARINSISLLTLVREAKVDHTFSNGLKISKGGFVGTPIYTVHNSEKIYSDVNEFKPWRFVGTDENYDENSLHQYVATSADFLAFGYGKHACPGRFFAANELKAMLCFVVMNYDVQLVGGSWERPANGYSGSSVLPNTSAKVMFRRRSAK